MTDVGIVLAERPGTPASSGPSTPVHLYGVAPVSLTRNRSMLKRAATLSAALLVAASGALAQDSATPAAPPTVKAPKNEASLPKLKVGDKAPPLSIEKWVKGEPITGFEKGRIYVVEFWA